MNGPSWRLTLHNLPPWHTVYQQTQRWLEAGCFDAVVHNLRRPPRGLLERQPELSAAVFDGRASQSTPQRYGRAGYDGAKRKGSKVHLAVDTPGHLLAVMVSAAR